LATAATVTRTNNAEIDGLLSGTKWTGPITYSFPDSPSDYLPGYSASNEPTTGFARTPAAEQAAINYAVGLIRSYTNASIQYAGAGSADIQIAQSSAANPTSYAYYPSNAAGGAGGDVWFGTFYDYSQAKLGNYEFTTALHELGHAFGLKHSQETGGVANVAVPSAHDDSEFTVMSYRSYVGGPLTGYTNEAYGYPQTYMANDILALQTLYGANFSTQSGNTTYSWNPTTGQEFINGVGQLAPGGGAGGSANRVFMTVWDGGGNDTYDLSNYSTAVSINLNPGASSITSTIQLANLGGGHYAQGNVFNAYLYNNDVRSYIDNAIGGSSNDTLVGNPIGNSLSGGAGNDRITGGGGDDFIDGGSGSDTAVFSGNLANYRIGWNSTTQAFTVADQRAGAPDGTDTIVGVENFQFADGIVSSSSFEMNHAPVVTAADVKVHPGQTLQASSLFSAIDPDNDALTYYFQDTTTAANSGYFVVNGTAMAQGASFGVSAAQLAQTVFVAGTDASDDLFVQVSDGQANSNLAEFHVNINHAPVVTVADMSAHAGQTLQVWSLFSAADADNDALTYTFQDSTPDPAIEDYAPAVHTGYFVVNGTVIAAGTSFSVSAAQLAQTFFVVGDAGTSDQLTVQVSDGQLVSNLGQFHLSGTSAVNRAPAASEDFNADGKSDALWVGNDGTATVWDNGQSSAAHQIASPALVPASVHIAGTGDFDGNGHDDILWRDDSGLVFVWNDGQPSGGHQIGNGGGVPSSLHIAGTGDFDGNGRDDVLWRDDGGGVFVWNDGQASGGHTAGGSVAASWHVAGTGDFDGNGKSDILWHNDDGSVAVWNNGQASGGHSLAAAGSVAASWHIAGTGDFDGNGKSDILWYNDNGSVAVWDNGQASGGHSLAAAGSIAASWHVAGTGDFDGNGKADIFWQNDDGSAAIWDNGQPNGGHVVGAVPAGWHII
jgi:hypothetical protein